MCWQQEKKINSVCSSELIHGHFRSSAAAAFVVNNESSPDQTAIKTDQSKGGPHSIHVSKQGNSSAGDWTEQRKYSIGLKLDMQRRGLVS